MRYVITTNQELEAFKKIVQTYKDEIRISEKGMKPWVDAITEYEEEGDARAQEQREIEVTK